jgi:hypothetical protein|tara:strand:+ start:139 stop:1116 length:978 start_codon:yes stop_codon:yes gene_type:complete
MKKIFSIVILLLFFPFKSFAAVDGKGQIQLSENVINSFMRYITGDTTKNNKNLFNKPSAFWVTIDGSRSYWWYCPHGGGCYDETSRERVICERETGQSCSRFARGRYVRWDNGINPKGKKAKFSSKMSESEVRAKLTKLGFIGNTSTTTKDNYDYPSLIAKQRYVHKSNWKDYVDYNNKYKAFVMAITKTKNDMTLGWQTDDTSWNDVIKKSFDRCNKYIKQKPKNYPKDSICILYYKGTTPTTDKEKIETAQKYYSKAKVEKFFKKYPDVLNDGNNSLIKKSIITKKTTSSDDIVSKLKDLKELLDSGVLSEEEFKKAKKKLLN